MCRLSTYTDSVINPPPPPPKSKSLQHILDWFDLKVQRYEAENKSFQILYKVVEHSQSLRVGRSSHIVQGPNLCRLKCDMLASQADLELLATVFVFLRPFAIVFPA